MSFVTLRYLTPDMAPSRRWLDRNGPVGMLLPETPGHDEFIGLVNRLIPGEPPTLEIAHAEFRVEFSSIMLDDFDTEFREMFRFSHEEVFVNLTTKLQRNVFRITFGHKFYAVFGAKVRFVTLFQSEI